MTIRRALLRWRQPAVAALRRRLRRQRGGRRAAALASREPDGELDERLHLLRAQRRHRASLVPALRWPRGPQVEPDGTPAGLDDFVLRRFRLRRSTVWPRRPSTCCRCCSTSTGAIRRATSSGVQIGRTTARARHAPELREPRSSIASFAPLFGRYGHDPRIHAWDLINEPEWVTFGLGTWSAPSERNSRQRAARATSGWPPSVLHALGSHPVTVGSASTRCLHAVQGLGLDFYQPHWYDKFERRNPLATPVAALGCDAPVAAWRVPDARIGRRRRRRYLDGSRGGLPGRDVLVRLADDARHRLRDGAQAGLDAVGGAEARPTYSRRRQPGSSRAGLQPGRREHGPVSWTAKYSSSSTNSSTSTTANDHFPGALRIRAFHLARVAVDHHLKRCAP